MYWLPVIIFRLRLEATNQSINLYFPLCVAVIQTNYDTELSLQIFVDTLYPY